MAAIFIPNQGELQIVDHKLALDLGIPKVQLSISTLGSPDGDRKNQGTWVHPQIASGNLALRGTKRRVQRWVHISIFCFGIAVAVAIFIGLAVMAGIYIYVITKEGKIEESMSNILSFVLGVAVTIAIEAKWGKDDSKR